jgi:hypothetical protein
MRQLGMIGILAALVTAPALAENAKQPCLGSFANGEPDGPAPGAQLILTDNQCESVTRREFRLQLLEIPQDGEAPMALSIGIKSGGGLIRFKIPFSF